MSGELERMIAEMRGEIEKLRRGNAQHIDTIHVLRKRLDVITREMEWLRAKLAEARDRLNGRSERRD